MMDGKFEYSIMSPYLNDKSLYDLYKFHLQYLNKDYKKLHDFIYNNANGVIATDMDYHIPLLGNESYLGLIPNAINIDTIDYLELQIEGKIKIFHGVNNDATIKKGNQYFIEAMKIIETKYPNKVDIKTTYDVPYNEYIKLYNDCHILLDQVYSQDQGYNALEAMAKGKVVFTGAEKEWLNYFNLKENTVAINVMPNVNDIVKKLEWLILNPDKILEISKNARAFIEKEHNYITITKKYLETWKKNQCNDE